VNGDGAGDATLFAEEVHMLAGRRCSRPTLVKPTTAAATDQIRRRRLPMPVPPLRMLSNTTVRNRTCRPHTAGLLPGVAAILER
jgi:hypothetical protein